jgi:hypothetical protein
MPKNFWDIMIFYQYSLRNLTAEVVADGMHFNHPIASSQRLDDV